TVYAGTKIGGVFKSKDSGATWDRSSQGISTRFVLSLAMDPATTATLYAGTQRSGIFKTTNAGGLWQLVSPVSSPVQALAIDPLTPSTVYAGSGSEGVLKTVNAGGTWISKNTGLTTLNVASLAIDPFTPSIVYTGTSNGMFKSLDGGDSWLPIST